MLALFTIGISLSVLAITHALSLAAAIPFSAEYIGAIDAGFNFKYALPFVPIYLLFRFFNVGKDSPKLMFGGPHIVHFISAFTGRPFSRYLDLNGNTKWQIIWGDLKAIFSPKSDEDKAISAIRWIRKLSSAAPKNALAIQKRIAALGPKPLLAAAGMAGEDFFDKQNIAETAAVLREIMNAKAGKKVDVSVLVPNPGPLLEKIYNQEFKPEQIFSVKIQPQDKEAVDEVIDAFAKSAALRAQTLQIKQIPGAEFTHKISRNTLVIDVSSLSDSKSANRVTEHIEELLLNKRWLLDFDHKIAFVANNMDESEIKSKLNKDLLNLLEKNIKQVRFGSNNALTKDWLEGWLKDWKGAGDYSVLSDNPQRWDMAILLILSATHSKPISSTQEMEKKIKDMFLVSLSQ
jgi:Icc-related predicted phosphoesterase